MRSRRRFLRLLGAAGGAVLLPRGRPRAARVHRWEGVALGAPARIELVGVPADRAAVVVEAALAELGRLEAIFSLYDPGSALSRLDRDGVLRDPPAELVEMVGLARRLAELSEGAFDPTVQPLWRAVAERAPAAERRAARARVNWRALEVSPEAIAFLRPGMAVTLDGIAQGLLTDRVAAVLRARGCARVLVDLGEVRAWGAGPRGEPWRIDLGAGERPLALVEGGLASSIAEPVAPFGAPRLIDARTGEPVAEGRRVAVWAPEAALADGLSTALAVADEAAARRLCAAFPQAVVL